ncbi:MAG TPA: oligosaccharide flippase family protein [Thermoanaerobaculia bacterium]|nr:oligosaccharide flippase family protein [Thermoanaerobaculia bacterium]
MRPVESDKKVVGQRLWSRLLRIVDHPDLLRRVAGSGLIRESATYISGNILIRSIPFLLLPVLTRYLSPEDFGRVTMFAIGVSMVAPLVGLSTDSAISRQYFERDTIDFSNYVTNCLYVMAASLAVLLPIAIALSGQLGAALALPPAWIWLLVVMAAARYIGNVTVVAWQVRHQPRPYAVYLFLQTLTVFGISIVLVVVLRFGWRGRVAGETAALLAFAVVGLVVLTRAGWIRHGFNKSHVRHAVSFGTGIVIHLYGSLLVIAADRFFLTHMLDVGQTGLYAVGAQVAMIIGVLEHSFNQAWSPWLFGRLKNGRRSDLTLIRRITAVYTGVIIGLALLLWLVTPYFLPLLVGKAFAGASQFVLWLALGNAFSGMYKMAVNQIFYMNRTDLLAVITVISGVVNLCLNYLLISRNGAVGAAQATAATFFLSYVLTYLLSRRVTRSLYASFSD